MFSLFWLTPGQLIPVSIPNYESKVVLNRVGTTTTVVVGVVPGIVEVAVPQTSIRTIVPVTTAQETYC